MHFWAKTLYFCQCAAVLRWTSQVKGTIMPRKQIRAFWGAGSRALTSCIPAKAEGGAFYLEPPFDRHKRRVAGLH